MKVTGDDVAFLEAQFHMFFPNKHLLVHIPKTGGTSLEHAICRKYFEQEEDNKIKQLSFEKYTVHGHFKKRLMGSHGIHTVLFQSTINT